MTQSGYQPKAGAEPGEPPSGGTLAVTPVQNRGTSLLGAADEIERLKTLLREVTMVQCRPGDMLVLRAPAGMRPDGLERMATAFENAFGDALKVIIVGAEVSIAGLIRVEQTPT